jgi:hypothetical protein
MHKLSFQRRFVRRSFAAFAANVFSVFRFCTILAEPRRNVKRNLQAEKFFVFFS